MSVTGNTVPDAARDPKHPDHDRWVKEHTLRMEVEHAKVVGLGLRHAESENIRLLERMEALAREQKPKQAARPRKSRQQRMLERAVEVREALPRRGEMTWLSSSPCGRCGLCVACRREKRILAISQRATQQKDPWSLKVMWGIVLFMNRINGGAGEYRGLSKADINRRVTAEAERVCDESVKFFGEWRK